MNANGKFLIGGVAMDYLVNAHGDNSGKISSITIFPCAGISIDVSSRQIDFFEAEGIDIFDWISQVALARILLAKTTVKAKASEKALSRELLNFDVELPRLFARLSKILPREIIDAKFHLANTHDLVALFKADDAAELEELFNNL